LTKSKGLYYIFLTLLVVIPLAITTYFYNIADLIKSSLLVFAGGLFICLALLQLFYGISKKNTISIRFDKSLDISVLVFLFACILSTIFSLRPAISFWGQYERQIGLVTYLYLAFIYFLSAYILDDEKKRKTAVFVMEIVSVVISTYAILQFLRIDPLGLMPATLSRPFSTLSNAVFLGGFLILALPFSAFNVSEKKNNILKYAFPLIIVMAIIVSETRSAYIGLAIQALGIFYFIFRKKILTVNKKKTIIAASLSTLLVSAVLIFYNNGVLIKRFTDIFSFNNPRLILWQDAFNIFYKYPLTGPGIGMFAPAFEEFYSSHLRYADALNVYDHAHSNYLQLLFTMGALGLIAYMYMLVRFFKRSVEIINKPNQNTWNKKLGQSLIIMLCGYFFYGLTNFDDLSIIFYLFIFLSIVRSVNVNVKNIRVSNKLKTTVAAAIFAIVILCLYNMGITYKKLEADRNFNIANSLFSTGDFQSGLKYNNLAIYSNPNCAFYRLYVAARVQSYCADNSRLTIEGKLNLLKQAETELSKVKDDLYYVNNLSGILSLVYYEAGRIPEADALKEQVLQHDSININFRTGLMRYLLKMNRLEEAKRSLDIILLIKPNDISSLLLGAMYYGQAEDKEKAILYSNKVLQKDPSNKVASNILNKFRRE